MQRPLLFAVWFEDICFCLEGTKLFVSLLLTPGLPLLCVRWNCTKLHFNMTLKGRDTASEWSRKATLNSLFQDLLWRMICCICFIFPPCSAAAWIGAKSGFDAGAV